ncbi:MAG: MBL fold metallo-hydrolase [Chlamydiae bacterium]|nr:MBL fold metallo-hydrolase [Chlamydiota bacterium]
MILHLFSFGPLQTTAAIFACTKTKLSAVIDPGVDSSAILLKTIQKEELILNKILLTHSHWDHIAGVHELRERTGASVYIHSSDEGNLQRPGSDRIPLFAPIEGAKPDHFLQDGQILEVGALQVHVIHTPGHSPGGVCFYIPSEKIIFSGDTLFRGTIGNLGLPTASASDMWPSLRKLALFPPDTRVIPGHGRETTIGQEKSWLARADELFK